MTAYSVMDFKVHWMGRRAAVENFIRETAGKDEAVIHSMPDAITYIVLLEEAKSVFTNMSKIWGPSKAAKENGPAAFTAQLQKLDAKITALQNKNGANTEKKETRKCFHCHEVGHISRNCPKKNQNKSGNSNNNNGGNSGDNNTGDKDKPNWKFVKNSNDGATKVVDGVTYH